MPGQSRRTSTPLYSSPLDGLLGRTPAPLSTGAFDFQPAPASTTAVATPLLDQAGGPAPLKQFPGYDAGWHQSQDALIRKVTDDFNREKGLKPGDPHYLDPNLVKAWALQESGGHEDVFTGGDMMQVNVTGDWVPEKSWFGLKKGEKMDPEKSLRTALEWAWYKGELTKGMKGDSPDSGWYATQRGTKAFPGYQSTFDGWDHALTDYNGGGVKDYYGQISRRPKAGK
jgi:hypothetical protein